jgi:multidrug resistance efflux pump
MSIPFSQTLHALDADAHGGRGRALLAGLVLLGLWLAWALLAEVPVLAASAAATVEPDQPPIVLAVPADGLVVAAAALAPGQRVRAGQALLVLDAGDLRARLAALRCHRAALAAEERSLAAQEAAARQALDETGRGRAAADGELAAAARQAADAAALAEQARERGQRLAAVGLLAAAEAARGRAEADQRSEGARAAALALAARSHQGLAALADRRAGLDRLAGERARLRGEIAALDGDAAGLAGEIGRRTLRAPAAGRLASLVPLAPGSRAAGGARLATLIAEGGPLRIRARFPAAAGAALRPGQRAWAHCAAGIASPAAALPAAVVTVAAPDGAAGANFADANDADANDAGTRAAGNALPPPSADAGSWEAILSLSPVTATATGAGALAAPTLPPRAGEPCRVEVEVARRTPAALLLGALRGAGTSNPW